MKITFLCENTLGYEARRDCLAEWGFSAFIQRKDASILFDAGHTDVYKRNAKALGVNLSDTDFVVLSHYHWDHTGGLRFHDFKTKKKLIIHPQILEKMPKEESDKIKGDFDLILQTKPLEFSKNVFYLGEIPRENDFEKGTFKGDKMLDDSALAIKTEKGLIVIAGCSHSGICNICEYAKKVIGQKLYAVIGGFHLFEDDQKAADGAIEYFKMEKPVFLYPMHCVDFSVLAKFYSAFGIKKLSTGDKLELED